MATIISIAVFSIYLYIGFTVLFLDRESLLNRLFFMLSMLFSLWVFAEIFLNFSDNQEVALLWIKVASVSWGFLPSLFLHFVLIWSEKWELLRKWWINILIYLPVLAELIFLSEMSTTSIEIIFSNTGISWRWDFQNTLQIVLNSSYIIIQNIYIALGFIIIIYWSLKTEITRKKKQAKLFLFFSAIILLISVLINFTGLTVFSISSSQLILLLVIFPFMGILYSMTHLGLLTLKCNNYSAQIMETIGKGIIWINRERKIRFVNSSAAEILDYRKEELINQPLNKIFPGRECDLLEDNNTGSQMRNEEKKLLTASGKEIPALLTVASLARFAREDDYLFLFNDITELKKTERELKEARNELEIKVYKKSLELANKNKELRQNIASRKNSQKKIKYLAYHDNVTDLPNRRSFMEIFRNTVGNLDFKGEKACVMFLDLDDFKLINDTFGHDVGDKLLIDVARRLKSILRDEDVIARLGGDEFIILLENFDIIDEIEVVAQKIITSFNEPFEIIGQKQKITISLGIAVYPQHGKNSEILIKNADIAMYEAKKSGKNNYKIFSPDMKSEIVENSKLINYLYNALEREEFEIYYQPQVNFKSKKIVGMEAFIRWNHPELGMVYPEKFLPVAEKTGLILPVEEWVIREVCKQNKLWQDKGLIHVPVAVNLSTLQFRMPQIVAQVEKILNETGLEHNYLEIEIKENVVMKNVKQVLKQLNDFKKSNIHIAINNFGLEYSSLQYLKELSIDRLKIAMSFIHGIGINEEDEVIIKTIINLANNLGMKVIAEGVETREQIEFLGNHMCTEVQGYYFFKPMPAAEIEKLIKSK